MLLGGTTELCDVGPWAGWSLLGRRVAPAAKGVNQRIGQCGDLPRIEPGTSNGSGDDLDFDVAGV
ncbi:MAG TPA: hypothetical protein VLD86_16335, partial [Ilumatobacteraceae bacterium]|nr:hypothetical protein [Ilumatobacteraceae bacterium]